jgi:cytoskeletal protein CcmA (bactofilin family)
MAETGNQTTIIGADTHIKGDMTFDGTAKLLGTFEGKISAKGDLHVAEGATCRAVVEAGRVTVDGSVEGNVTARERVELTAKARMKGDLVASRLLVAEGASFTGHVTVGSEAAKSGKLQDNAAMMAEPKPGAGAPARPEPARR